MLYIMRPLLILVFSCFRDSRYILPHNQNYTGSSCGQKPLLLSLCFWPSVGGEWLGHQTHGKEDEWMDDSTRLSFFTPSPNQNKDKANLCCDWISVLVASLKSVPNFICMRSNLPFVLYYPSRQLTERLKFPTAFEGGGIRPLSFLPMGSCFLLFSSDCSNTSLTYYALYHYKINLSLKASCFAFLLVWCSLLMISWITLQQHTLDKRSTLASAFSPLYGLLIHSALLIRASPFCDSLSLIYEPDCVLLITI